MALPRNDGYINQRLAGYAVWPYGFWEIHYVAVEAGQMRG